jgi:hypothetical protein
MCVREREREKTSNQLTIFRIILILIDSSE